MGDMLQVPGGGPVVGQMVNGVPSFDQQAVSALVAAPSAAGGTTTATPMPPAIPSSPPPTVPADPLPPAAGTTASPDASKPTTVSTPIPDSPTAPNVTPGAPTDGTQGPTVMAVDSTLLKAMEEAIRESQFTGGKVTTVTAGPTSISVSDPSLGPNQVRYNVDFADEFRKITNYSVNYDSLTNQFGIIKPSSGKQ